jgi:hypothetical protein
VSNIQINLSTTARVPEGLSSTFADNVGVDDKVVFNGSLSVTSVFSGPASGPKVFDIILPLTPPFVYNPTAGNLLVDIRNYSGSTASLVSGQAVNGDGASRVLGNVNSASGVPDNGADAFLIVYSPTNVAPPPGPDNCISNALVGLTDLIARIQRLESSVNTSPLLASLRTAQSSFLRGNKRAAINQLHAFENKLQAQMARIDVGLLNSLNALADAIVTAANCNVGLAVQRTSSIALRIHPGVTEGGFKMSFSGETGESYDIQVSEDLRSWRTIGGAVEVAQGFFEYVVFETSGSANRFYRALKAGTVTP